MSTNAMPPNDRFELPLSSASDKAIALYCDGVDQLLSFQANALNTLEQAIAHDDQFALAHIARARALQVRARVSDARQAAVTARQLATELTDRERQHVEILALVVESRPAKALTLLLKHCDQWPRDALPMSVALGAIGLFAFSGRPDSRTRERQFLESLASHWPEHWWFDTYYGWVLVETGDHSQGNALLDRALLAYPMNAQAVHARAHGYYESGEIPAGQMFLQEQMLQLDADSLLMPHLRWHQALMALQAGDPTSAKAIYAEAIAPDVSEAMPLLLMMDAASFAWRCHIYGQPLAPAQLGMVRDQANACLPAAGPSFFNWHKAMALASAGDQQGLTLLAGEINELIKAGRQPPGDVIHWICQAMSAVAAEHWSQACENLEKANRVVGAIGGSNAQQDAITDALIAACLACDQTARARELTQACDQTARARELTQARAARRALHLDQRWMQQLPAN